MKPKPIKKLYYSISEVSKLTSLKAYVLRYWETEFSELRPAKNRAGNRIYRLNDIKLIFYIKKLLYEEKFTIEGARQKLKSVLKEKPIQMAIPFNDFTKEEMIADIRRDLQEILDILNDNLDQPEENAAENTADKSPEEEKTGDQEYKVKNNISGQ
ncbi:MerR family transcriptional regulator [candidate division KSB1 bacterium]|nr:MerR family transcriptional regulator [candidate division KSB1 bacterium]